MAVLNYVAAALLMTFHFHSTPCLAITAEDVSKVNVACAVCDQNFTIYVNDYENKFYQGFDNSADPLDVGSFHCSKMAQVAECYNDCLHGLNLVYTSMKHNLFTLFYKQFCDPDCLLAFLPYCFLSQGMGYNLYRTGCDDDQHMLQPSISACISYWASTQHCTGVCTPGQRALSTLTLMLESICRIPIRADDCGININSCMEQTFGAFGVNFIQLTAIDAISNNSTCSRFYNAFVNCIHNTVDGHTTIGSGPVAYRISYESPCGPYDDAVQVLDTLAAAAVRPLCDVPTVNLTSYCVGSLHATTMARTSLSTTKATTLRATRYTGATTKGSTPKQTTAGKASLVTGDAEGTDATQSASTNLVASFSRPKPTAGQAPAGQASKEADNAGLRLRSHLILMGLGAAVAALVRCF